ncbi:isochorismate synthase [Parabacteroides sp. OttesenSCG-928-K15]|nr:isochorismate synthase [Parabacteroides sp. OttesenSCG-928-K15]
MEHVYAAIDTAIHDNRSFVVYRLPNDNKLRFVSATTEDAVQTFYDFNELNGQEGYIIAPFGISDECPIVCIQAEEVCWEYPEESPFTSSGEEYAEFAHITPRYKKRFHTFMAAFHEWGMQKLVLSRQLKMERPPMFSPTETFIKACYRYPNAYVYLFHTPVTGTWLGCTPELLLEGEGSDWKAVALAGTQPVIDGKVPTVWSEKNYEEQRFVSDYIYNQLQASGIATEEEGPFIVQAGEVAHLSSTFRFQLPDNNYIGDLLQLMHPTPAVCGLPKEDAYWYIVDHEGYPREYYSGFLGWLQPEGKTKLYMNLRCMQIGAKILMLYAGSGLLPLSTADDEWMETESKMQTLKAIINY